jgi:hypothetical protein
MRKTLVVAVLAATLATTLTGCRTDAAKSKAFITRDGKVVLQPSPKAKGETIIRIENDSPSRRQVVLVHLDEGQDAAALPINDDGVLPVGKPSDLEHRGDGYRVVEKLDGMRPYYGGDQRIVTTMHTYLRPGSYVLMSNLPGDYAKGVWTQFTVGGSS